MENRRRVDLQAAIICDIVTVPIPATDRGTGDARNTLGAVINKTGNDKCGIAANGGLLNGDYKTSVLPIPSSSLRCVHVCFSS